MYNENIETIYYTILAKNLPDKDIEIFWYSWKNAICNAFKKNDKVINQFKLEIYSDNLNMLQENNDYIAIQQIIQTYLERHAILCIENYIDSYNCNIVNTHLNRWSKLTKKSNKLTNNKLRDSNYNFKLFSLYLIILNEKTIQETIIDGITYNKNYLLDLTISYNFTDIADYAIRNNKINLLDKILAIKDINDYIKNKYKINYFKGTGALKIIKKIKSNQVLNA